MKELKNKLLKKHYSKASSYWAHWDFLLYNSHADTKNRRSENSWCILMFILLAATFIFALFLTLSAQRAAGSGIKGCRGRSLLPCTHVRRVCKKQLCFEENWMNFLKMLVLNLNSLYLLRYKLRFLSFF